MKRDDESDVSAEALDAYEELRTGFTAVVSHELRTPLARVMALLDSAELKGADPAALLQQVRVELEGIAALVDDVLFLAELESGRAVVAFGPIKALPELERIARQSGERADRADLAIQVDGDPDAVVPLRPRMLTVIVENLIENALRYAGPGATLHLRVDRDESGTTIFAEDNGTGVDDSDLPRLFERFYRGDRARTSRGTGLGLAIVKHVVTTAGGSVEATRGPGGGLEIRCRFPG